MAVVRARGVICHDTPHLSLHHPHALSWLPLLTIAFHKPFEFEFSNSMAVWFHSLRQLPPVSIQNRLITAIGFHVVECLLP